MEKYNEIKLKNGLKLSFLTMPGTNTITLLVIFKTGSKYESRQNNGISHFLEHMFFKGNEKRPGALEIAGELDSVGGEYNAFTGKEYTGYWVKVNKDKLVVALDVLSDMLLHSKFDIEEIKREKGVIIEELNMYEDNPMMHVEDTFEQCLYGDTPAGWDVVGTKETISSFQREDFLNYFKSQYGSKSATVVIAGSLEEKDFEICASYFNDLAENNFVDKEQVVDNQKEPKVLLEYKATDQYHLALGVRAYAVGHKDEIALKILGLILGGGMSSRLFTALREREGLAYYVRTQIENYTDCGYLSTQAGLRLNEIEKAIKIILGEYDRLRTELVPEIELQKAKDMIAGRLAISLESSDNLANWYAKQFVLRGQAISSEAFLAKVNQVSTLDIQRVAQDIFVNQKLNLAIIGPGRDKEKFKALLSF